MGRARRRGEAGAEKRNWGEWMEGGLKGKKRESGEMGRPYGLTARQSKGDK